MTKRATAGAAAANSYGFDGRKILVWGPRGAIAVPKRDAVRLASVCLVTQRKYVLVDLKRYTKDLRELERLRKLTAERTRR